MVVVHNSTKYTKKSELARREEFLNRMSDIPISIDGSKYQEPKGLITSRSKGPNRDANISYAPEPGVEKDPTDDIPSGLHTLQQGSNTIRITSDVITGGDGRVLKRNRWT
jgi:hypothetical protein